MAFRYVGYLWDKRQARLAGKEPPKRVHPSQRPKPGERAEHIRKLKLERAMMRELQREHREKVRANKLEEQFLRREEAKLAAKAKRMADEAQYEYEKNMEDYVMGRLDAN